MSTNRYASIEAWLRQLGRHQQVDLALRLASLVEPFASLPAESAPAGALARAAESIRIADTDVAVDRARHELFSLPEMAQADEPLGIAWFPYQVAVAWIYAADSKCTAPGDGLVNTFKCVLDMLDALDDELGGIDLAEEFTEQIENGGDSLDSLRSKIVDGVAQLARASQGS
jgi:hypothetical protein